MNTCQHNKTQILQYLILCVILKIRNIGTDMSEQIKRLYTSKEAAKYLGFSDDYLRASRVSGLLSGVEAPIFMKLGRGRIRYEKEALDQWIEKQKKDDRCLDF